MSPDEARAEMAEVRADLDDCWRQLAAAYYAIRLYIKESGKPWLLQQPPHTNIEATLRRLTERYGDPGRDRRAPPSSDTDTDNGGQACSTE